MKGRLDSKKIVPYLFISPFFIIFSIFFAGPIIFSFYFSLTRWKGFSPPRFIGLANYLALFHDARFWAALGNTVWFVVIYNIIMIGLAIMIAIMLNSTIIKGKPFFRAAYFAPVTMALAIVAVIFDIIYAKHGLLNIVLTGLGIPCEVSWLQEEKFALKAFVGLRVWRATGYYAAILLAGYSQFHRSYTRQPG